MSIYEPSGVSVTRTFRVEKVWDEVLEKEADRLGVSVSSLLNNIVREYVYVLRFYNRNQSLIIKYPIIKPMIDKLSEVDISLLAKMAGSYIPEEEILQRGLTLNFKSIMLYIDEICGKYNKWFDFEHYVTMEKSTFYLHHGFDRKWSVYLSNFFSSMFDSIFEIDVNSRIHKDSVSIVISNKDLKRVKKV